jgi:hypothetical protein
MSKSELTLVDIGAERCAQSKGIEKAQNKGSDRRLMRSAGQQGLLRLEGAVVRLDVV